MSFFQSSNYTEEIHKFGVLSFEVYDERGHELLMKIKQSYRSNSICRSYLKTNWVLFKTKTID